ncbi:MAG: helix-turn-helix domain-containing protein [Lachnospiraceae bacterium]|nr:helix-turn-helix domain-containing protein [Lachnospiraceae bacterium]
MGCEKAYIGAVVTEEEKQLLCALARAENISLSEFIKRKLLVDADKEQAALPEMLTVDEMACYLHVSRRKARAMCESGTVPSRKFGKSYRVLKKALDEFLVRDMGQYQDLPELLRPEEAANYLKISRCTLNRMIVSGEIKTVRISNRHRIKREVVAQMVGA